MYSYGQPVGSCLLINKHSIINPSHHLPKERCERIWEMVIYTWLTREDENLVYKMNKTIKSGIKNVLSSFYRIKDAS